MSYTDLAAFTPNWNPRSTGSKKENNKVQLPPTDKSWIEGHYLNTRTQVINGDPYTIHKIAAIAVGDEAHLGEPLSHLKEYEFFGSHVVNSLIAEKVPNGACIKIQWEGLKQPKTEGGREYQGWKVLINNGVAPIAVQNGVIVNADAGNAGTQPGTGVAGDTGMQGPADNNVAVPQDAPDDDLPF